MNDDYNFDFPSFGDDEPEEPTPKPMTQSILLTVKKMLGIAEEYHAFDLDICININAVFLTLNQLGVGPSTPYHITDDNPTWKDFLGEQEEFLAGVQSYVFMRVRLMFDPPTNSFLVDSFLKQCQELEWRFTVQPKNQAELDKQESFKETHKKDSVEEDPDDSQENQRPSGEDISKNQNGTTTEEETTVETEDVTPIPLTTIQSSNVIDYQKVSKASPKTVMDIFS